jgi:hypothetical protein
MVTGTLPVTTAFVGGFAGFALGPLAIVALQDEHVWKSLFPVVDQTFPGDKQPAAKKVAYGLTKPHHVIVHGMDTIRCKPSFQAQDILDTFNLLRRVITKMILDRAVATKDQLEQRLFGA